MGRSCYPFDEHSSSVIQLIGCSNGLLESTRPAAEVNGR
jgi:hypothetical protein